MTPEVQAAVERLKTDAQDELEAHAEWLAENPDEQDPGPEGIDVSPRTLLAILSALATSEARRGELEGALKDIGLTLPASDCATFRPDLDHKDFRYFVRDFARAALNPQQEGSRDHG